MQERSLQRISLSVYFLLSGICFSSWASRIPTIKDKFLLNEQELGSLLMVMPVSAIIGIPLSGWLVSKYDSRIPQQFAYIGYFISLFLIGFSSHLYLLIFSLFLFALCLRIINITINTQSISVQEKFEKRIVGSFHGLWSIGGVIGVLITTLMLQLKISVQIHFLIVALLSLVSVFIAYPYLIKNDKSTNNTKFKLGKPNRFIMLLGLMLFFASICEGGIYDWNGVYFKDVVKVEVFTYGYLLFMICMSASRFIIDKLMERFGIKKLYYFSAVLIMSGMSVVVLFPVFWIALIGFCLTGFGVASLFPMTFIMAGKAKKYATGIVIAIVGTYATVGMFLGPPLIGYLAEYFGLQRAFIVLIIGGFMYIPLTRAVFKHLKER
ncbi:MFS transporter [Polaribacter sargassicola]|uniref:MFS transporter n=1 Tax=Polaribacter sargassicola TaxID=2836891 RepID=UPI001F2C4750|nr:MFS transporter [Polaribacter sp. DS7-9]MCG1036839.1 MFS transporter [Polaribacter sp. DS7-9]